MTAFSSGASLSIRSMAAVTSSNGVISPRRTRSAWAVASNQVRSSVMDPDGTDQRGSSASVILPIVRMVGTEDPATPVRQAELLCALSLGTDLSQGQTLEWELRSARLAL